MQLTLVRNATLILEYAGQKILIDPYFAPKQTLPTYTGASKNPLVDLPMPTTKIVEDIDAVIVSHLHTDHFDEAAQDALDKDILLYCQPNDADTIRGKGFTQVKPIADAENLADITIARTAGHHGLGAVERLMGQVSGFVFTAPNEPTVYWAGDTVFCAEVREAIALHKPDIIITHSGGATWANPEKPDMRDPIIMDAQQTLAVHQLMPTAKIIATHMEALDHCVTTRQALRRVVDDAGLSSEQMLIPSDGQRLIF